MPHFSDAELAEIRLIHELVCEELRRQGLPILDSRPIDEIIASGTFKAAECFVRSKDMVTPGWWKRSASDGTDPPESGRPA